jgi:ATP-dependent DNA ligase
VHRDKDQFVYYSRNGHDYTSVFGLDSNNIGTLTPYIANTFKIDCEKCIIGKLENRFFEKNSFCYII